MKIYKLKKDLDFGGSIIPTGTLFYLDNTNNLSNPACFYESMVPINSHNGLGFTVETNDKDYCALSNNGIDWRDWFEYVEEKTAEQIGNPDLINSVCDYYKFVWNEIAELKHLEKVLSTCKNMEQEKIDELKEAIEYQKQYVDEHVKLYESFTGEKF